MININHLNDLANDKSYIYQIALKSMNVGTWEWNINTGELIFDDRWAEIIGYKKEELLPATVDLWKNLLHEEDKEKTLAELDKHFKHQSEYYAIEFRMKHKDGYWVWVLSKGQVTEYDRFGNPIKMFGAHLDITDSKTLEKMKLNTQYNELIENAPFPIIISNAKNGQLIYGNKRAKVQFGLSGDEGIGQQTADYYVNKKDREFFLAELTKNGFIYDFEVELYNYHKEKYWALMSASFTLYEEEFSILITINDITNRKMIEQDLNIERDKYRLLADSMADVIMVFNSKDLKFKYISPSVFELRGYTVEEALNQSFDEIISSNDKHHILSNLKKDLDYFILNPFEKKSYIYEYQENHKNGELIWVETSYRFRFNEENEIEVISTHRNIEERKRIEARIEYLNLYEVNTGLLNKTAFRLFEEEWKRKGNPNYKYSVIYVDIDQFGEINDSLGHHIGDKIIIDIAHKMNDLIGSKGNIYHYDGDEFLIVLFNDVYDEVLNLSKQISKLISQQLVIDEYSYLLTASIGFSLSNYGEDIEKVFKKASIALSNAKQTRNSIVGYNDEFAQKISRESVLEHDLHYAIERNELELYFQPIYDVNTGKVDQAEALIRWNHPLYGLVSPIDFIPIAERTRLILPITDWTIHQVCQILAKRDQFNNPLTISINISFVTIDNRGDELYSFIRREILSSGIKPEYLKLEITETSLVQDSAEVIRVFIRLKELGLRLALDDFGTGYSSFGYLKALPLDIVKIDRSLIRNIEWDTKGRMIVESMITVLHGLNLRVVVEGVETKNQYDILYSMKADSIQGYLFSKPMKLELFEDYYQNVKDLNNLPIKYQGYDDSGIILHWRSEWNSGHPKNDDQHRILMKLAAELERSTLLNHDDSKLFLHQVNQIIQEIENHFRDEESILKKQGYPHLFEHEIEHQKLTNQLIKLWDLYQKHEVDVYAFVRYVVKDVIWDHLLKEDAKFFPYVSTLKSNKPINYIPTYFPEESSDDTLEYRKLLTFNLNLQALLTDISTTFISVNLTDFDSKVNYALKHCAKHVEADRAYIFKYDWINKDCSNTYEWCQEGIIPQISELQNIPIDSIPDWANAHIMGETIYIPDVNDLDINSNLRQILEPQEIQSLLTVPMMIDNVCYGFIGFDSVKSKHAYSDYERAILKEVSNVFLVALKRKEIEEKLLDEKEFYELTVSSLNEALIVTNDEYLVTYINKIAEKILDKILLDIRGKDIRNVFLPVSLSNGKSIDIDWESIKNLPTKYKIDPNVGFVQSDGYIKFIGGTISPIKTATNTFKGLLLHFRDVTEKFEGYEQIEAFLNINQDMLCVADYKGHFIRVNRKFTEELGYSIQELEGKYFLDLVHPDDVHPTINFIESLSKKGEVKYFSNRYYTKDGIYKTIDWVVQSGSGRYMYASGKVNNDKKEAVTNKQL